MIKKMVEKVKFDSCRTKPASNVNTFAESEKKEIRRYGKK